MACKPHCIRAQVILYADNHAFGSNANSKIVLRIANIDGGEQSNYTDVIVIVR